MRATIFLAFALILFGCTDSTTGYDSPSDHHIYATGGPSPVGESLIVVEPSKIQSRPYFDSPGREFPIEVGDTVEVVGWELPGGVSYYRVHHDGKGKQTRKGWKGDEDALSSIEYYRFLRDSGYEIMVTEQDLKERANEVSLYLRFANISPEKAVKHGSATWRLFDEAGTPVSTDNVDGNKVRTHFGSSPNTSSRGFARSFAYTSFDIGYGPEVECAELRQIDLEFVSGDTSAYRGESLQKVAGQAKEARLEGDCS